jgi:clan AA aspartic protease
MGLIYADLTLSNPREDKLKPVKVKSLVDTGAMFTCIPEHLAIQLKLKEIQTREVTTADGKKHLCPYVGPIQIHFENRICLAGALVLGDSVLLGVIQMEDMDVLINPLKSKLTVNPESPNIPSGIIKKNS